MKKHTYKSANDCIRNFNEHRGHPLKILLGFYKGEFWTLLKSTIFLTIQNLPVWVVPVVTANIINIATNPNEHVFSEIVINAVIMSVVVLQNAYTTFSVSRIYNQLTRRIEYMLRSSIVQKLQQLSISYHKNNNL